jgi:membrane-bound lytic murein transglycosylase B
MAFSKMAFHRPILPLAAVTLVATSLVATGLVASLISPAGAQENPSTWMTRLFQPPAGSPVPGPSDATPQWSGQSGASGDPRMTADAIRAAADDFGNCLAGLWPYAERHHP